MADKQEIQGMEYKVDSNTFSAVDDDDIAKANQNSKQTANSKTQSTSEKQNSEPPANQSEGGDKTQNSEPPSNPHEGEYLVCQGAKCQCDCDASRALVELVVKNDHHIINSKGQDKLVASVIENNFKSKFGTCKNNSSKPCVYQAMPTNKWQETSESKLPTVDGHAVLLESAKLICPIFKGNITFLTHGQTVNAAPADAEQTDTAAANAICCTSEPIKEKIPKGNAPSVGKISYKTIDSEEKIKEITIRTKTPATFKAVLGKKSPSKDTSMISWAIWDRKDKEAVPSFGAEKDIFWYYGDTLTTEFAAEGDYFIEGFGKMNPNSSDVKESEKRTKTYKNCTFLVHARENGIEKIIQTGPKGVNIYRTDLGLDIGEKEGSVSTNEYKLALNQTYIFRPRFIFDDDIRAEDIKDLMVTIRTYDKRTAVSIYSNSEEAAGNSAGGGNIQKFIDNKGSFYFKKVDAEGAYIIETSVKGKKIKDEPRLIVLAAEMNKEIQSEPLDKARPNTVIKFTAKFGNKNYDPNNICWYIDGSQLKNAAGTLVHGTSIQYTAKASSFKITAKYVRSGMIFGGFKINSGTTATKNYTIAKQEVTFVAISNMPFFATGAKVDIKALTVFADNNNGSEFVEYIIKQFAPQEGLIAAKKVLVGTTLNFKPPTTGQYVISARICTPSNSAKWVKSMPLIVMACRIETWEFCDSKKIKRTKLGWKQPVYIHIKIAGMENQSATIHLWYDDQGRFDRFHEINDASLKSGNTFDSNGEVFIKVCETDATWKQIGDWKKKEMRLCFTVEKEMICSNSKQGANKVNHIYPAKSEKALYDGSTLTINTKEEKYDGVFLKSNGEEAIEILPYSEPATAIAYVMGKYVKDTQKSDIPKNKYRMEIWQNRIGVADVNVFSKGELQPDEEGAIKVYIRSKEKGHDSKRPYQPRMFYFKLYDEKTNKYLMSYPDDGGNDEYDVDWNKENDGTKGAITAKRETILRNYFKELKFAKDLKFNTNIDNAAVKIGCKKIETNEGNCGGKYCITRANYKQKKNADKLIQEINIRLAGFGGNVPTDEFEVRTENAIKQFQRDYMKVTPTGRICGSLLKAIDEFSTNATYDFDFSKTACSCTRKGITPQPGDIACTGYGRGLHSEERGIKGGEGTRKYEYPGMHRSLLWALRGVIFYLKDKQYPYSFLKIDSAYRCWTDNHDGKRHDDKKPRGTTNHMGKALDLWFIKRGTTPINNKDHERNKDIIDKIRDDIFVKYMEAVRNWAKPNHLSLEPKRIAGTWIHFDVRTFDVSYLKDKFFVKNEADFKGESLISLAKNLGLTDMCNCTVIGNLLESNAAKGNRVDPHTLTTSDACIKYMQSWESHELTAYNDGKKGGYATIGYGHLIYKATCEVLARKGRFPLNDISKEEFDNGITEERANELFKKDLKEVETAIRRDVTVPLYQQEFDALVSLLFNAGAYLLRNGGAPNLYANLQSEKYSEAAEEFRDIVHSNGKEVPGLVTRRGEEIDMFKDGKYTIHKTSNNK